MPVSLSRFIIERWIGAAPLNLGSKDAWIFINPFLQISKIPFGNICPYATTIAISASNFFKIFFSSSKFLKFFEQDHSKATYANKVKKEEGRIDWNDEAENIIGKINGLYPVPGAWFYFDGARYKILKASISKNSATPGTVIDDDIEVSCGTNSIKILEIQREGKKIQNIKDFILGTKIKKGVNLINA